MGQVWPGYTVGLILSVGIFSMTVLDIMKWVTGLPGLVC